MPGTLPDSVIGSVVHASAIMLRNQRADAIDDLVGKYPILKLPPSTPPTQSSFDFANAAELIRVGNETATDFLSQLPALTDSRPSADNEQPPPPAPQTITPEQQRDEEPQSRIKL